MVSTFLQIEHKLKQVEDFYSTIGVSNSGSRHVVGIRKVQQEAARREAVAAKRMNDLIRQFGTIFRQVKIVFFATGIDLGIDVLRKNFESLLNLIVLVFSQITQHKCAWPFLHPVNVEGLGLHDYYEVTFFRLSFQLILLISCFW